LLGGAPANIPVGGQMLYDLLEHMPKQKPANAYQNKQSGN